VARVTTSLRQQVESYLRLRRQLGYVDEDVAPGLRRFAEFLRRRAAKAITAKLAVQWARQSPASDARYAARLSWVRNLAVHLSVIDARHQIPSRTLLPAKYHRGQPFIYTDGQVRALISAARDLQSPTGLRPAVYATLIGLLSVTGLRSGEALALDDGEVDLSEGVLTIRRGKFLKERLVTIHPTTIRALRDYVALRDRLVPRRASPAFFVGELGGRLGKSRVCVIFRRLCTKAEVARDGNSPRSRPPRLHDFRHTLAVNTLVRWQRDAADVDADLPILTTFLGHRSVDDTYWYMTATPELLRVAANRGQTAKGSR